MATTKKQKSVSKKLTPGKVYYKDFVDCCKQSLGSLKTDLTNLSKDPNESFYKVFIAKSLLDAYDNKNYAAWKKVADWIMPESLSEEMKVEEIVASEQLIQIQQKKLEEHAFAAQVKVIKDKTEKIIMLVPRQSGKTEAACIKMLYSACTPNTPIYYVSKSHKLGIATIWTRLLDIAAACHIPIRKSSKGDGRIEFDNGSYIEIHGNNDRSAADALRGPSVKLVVIDEAGFQTNLKYAYEEVLSPMQNIFPDRQTILLSTPPRQKGTFFENTWKNPSEWSKHQWSIFENTFIKDPQKILDDKKNELGDSAKYHREYLAEFDYDSSAQIFNIKSTVNDTIDIDDETSIKKVLDAIKPCYCTIGVDHGVRAYTAIVSLYYNKQGEGIYLFDYRINHTTTDVIAQEIKRQRAFAEKILKIYQVHTKERTDLYGRILQPASSTKYQLDVVVDSSAAQLINDLYSTYGIHEAKGSYKLDKMNAVENLSIAVNTNKLKIMEGSLVHKDFDIISYEIDPDTEKVNPEQLAYELLDGHGDTFDAALYAFREYEWKIKGKR